MSQTIKMVAFLLMLTVGVVACTFRISDATSTSTAGNGGPVVASNTPFPPTATPSPDNTSPAPTAPEQDKEEPTLAPTQTQVQSTAAPSLETLQVELEPVANALDGPIGIANAGDGSQRLFVLEKPGAVRIIDNGELLQAPFLDITDRVGASGSEQGLLGLAFHPNYEENGFFFVNYTDDRGDTVIARYSVTNESNTADPGSETVLFNITQPARNHNGGHLAFGPDGYLYIGLGDGGGAGDTFGNGQNLTSVLGTMLRIDVDQLPYSIPPDNPFVNDANARDEIWAYGLRNPWRYSFDSQTGDLYIADVGQNVYEEINLQPAGSSGGENYGWPIMEGFHCFPESADCSQEALVLPVAEYDHSQGCSVTGGHVYHGGQFPEMNGVYFFGDYCSGIIWGLARNADGSWQVAELLRSGTRLTSFGVDEAGEIYITDIENGNVYRLVSR